MINISGLFNQENATERFENNYPLDEQRYNNTSSLYWHGSATEGIRHLKATAQFGETVPLAWVSYSFEYAERYSSILGDKGCMYLIRQLRAINVWNPMVTNDWKALVVKQPSFDTPQMRNFLIKKDWLDHSKAAPIKNFNRDDLLKIIAQLGYSGVYNLEVKEAFPTMGLFSDFADAFAVIRCYVWNSKTKDWYNVQDNSDIIYLDSKGKANFRKRVADNS